MLSFRPALLLLLTACQGALAQQPASSVYRCPGPPVLYTDALSAKEAQDKGCRTIEGTPITIVQSPKPRAAAAPAGASGGEGGRIDAGQQRARDGERRRVLEAELRDAEARFSTAQAEYAGGNAERVGAESRNYQKYLDRMADLKASVNRQETDIQALKREISKLP